MNKKKTILGKLAAPALNELADGRLKEEVSETYSLQQQPQKSAQPTANSTVELEQSFTPEKVAPAGLMSETLSEQTVTTHAEFMPESYGGDVLETDLGVIGRYVLQSELGRGGMGVVYQAWDTELGRYVALKMLLLGSRASQDQRRRFVQEARIVARLEHPAIVNILDWGVDSGAPYYTMDLLPHAGLLERMSAGPIEPRQAATILTTVCGALQLAHEKGVVHRDIKPSNILMTAEGFPLLTDFGVARIDWDEASLMTGTGQLLGTPAYMAPEQALGGSELVGPWSDIYSMGAVFYHMLTGSAPYSGAQALSPQLRSSSPVPNARQHNPSVPKALSLIVNKAMSSEPQERYSSASALAEDLQRFIRSEPVLASEPSLLRRLGWQLRSRRHFLQPALVATVVLSTVFWAIDLAGNWQEAEHKRSRELEAQRQFEALIPELQTMANQSSQQGAFEAVEAFVALPEVRGTAASAKALLAGAKLALDGGRDSFALELAARAYLLAELAGEQKQILLFFAELLEEKGDVEGLLALDQQLGSQLRSLSPEYRRSVAAAKWDLGALLSMDELQSVPLPYDALAALSHGKPLHLQVEGPMTAWGSVGQPDGLDDYVNDHTVLVSAFFPEDIGPAVRSEAPQGESFSGPVLNLGRLNGEPAFAIRTISAEDSEETVALYYRKNQEWQVIEELPFNHILGAVGGDLNGDGEGEIYVIHELNLYSLLSDEGGFELISPHAPTNRSNSYLRAIAITDMNGDEQDELVVAVDGWKAYDLRVLVDEGDLSDLKMVARRCVGTVATLIPLTFEGGRTLLAISRSNDAPNPVVFPPEHPSGLPPGVHILELIGDSLETLAYIPPPVAGALPGSLHGGDFDGDGQSELVINSWLADGSGEQKAGQRFLQIVGFDEEVRPVSLRLPDLKAWGTLDADGDGDDEVIVGGLDGSELWMLGSGSEVPPTRPLQKAKIDGAQYIEGAVPLGAWGRAEQLTTLGLGGMGLEPMSLLASALSDPKTISQARLRQGELEERAGRYKRAAELFEEAAKEESSAEQALTRAATCWARCWRDEDELRVLQRLDALLPLTTAAEARRDYLLGRQSLRALDFDFSESMDRQWLVLRPWLIHREANVAQLEVRSQGRGRVLAQYPFEWTGERLDVDLRGSLRPLELGAGLIFALRPLGSEDLNDALFLSVDAWGGTGSHRVSVSAGVKDEQKVVLSDIHMNEVNEGMGLSLKMKVSAERREVHFQFREGALILPIPEGKRLAPGLWELIVREKKVPMGVEITANIVLDQITILGAKELDGLKHPLSASTLLSEAALSLVEGEAHQAELLLRREPSLDAPSIRLALACMVPDEGCRDALDLRGRDWAEPWNPKLSVVLDLLHRSPSATIALLRTELSAYQVLLLFDRAWGSALNFQEQHPELTIPMLAGLAALDLPASLASKKAEEVLLAAELSLAYGEIWHRLGQPRTGLAILQEAGKLFEPWTTLSGHEQRARRIMRLIEAHCAESAAASGLGDALRTHVSRALMWSPNPVQQAERFAVQPDIRPWLGQGVIDSLIKPMDFAPGPI